MKSLFMIFILLLSCSPEKTEQIFGVYTSPEVSYLNKLKHGNFFIKLKLNLREDYTYEYSTCAQKESGKWKIVNDQLELYCEKKRFIIDSFNHLEKYKRGKICNPVQIFSYEKGKLQQNIKVQNKDYKMLLLKQK
ncbi:hypothetical protein NZ698_10430 [Chryseobacterium sp. PBS4-4]|uniref:Lipoprotein n=1 Tax=Chryseobacterium edaphi TaxID=2976532 RepID=A0ABT2W5Z2_9FLAO|nr:hypothetical protein [Chryseobacterium edaphi]MCU7617613.1 hypothetical protein [Chryseobacterium edaphi]